MVFIDSAVWVDLHRENINCEFETMRQETLNYISNRTELNDLFLLGRSRHWTELQRPGSIKPLSIRNKL